MDVFVVAITFIPRAALQLLFSIRNISFITVAITFIPRAALQRRVIGLFVPLRERLQSLSFREPRCNRIILIRPSRRRRETALR